MTTVQVTDTVPGRAPQSPVAGAPRLPHRYLPRPDLWSRLDVATRGLLHVAFVVSARGAVLPNFRGDALGLAAAGIGVRLQ